MSAVKMVLCSVGAFSCGQNFVNRLAEALRIQLQDAPILQLISRILYNRIEFEMFRADYDTSNDYGSGSYQV